MEIDLILLKRISILSILFGSIIGGLTLIPYIGTITFIFLICFMAPLVICLLVKYNCLSLSSVQTSIITGAISGFISFLSFSFVYIPISIILMKFWGLTANYGVGLMLVNANFFLLTVISIFIGVVGATVNAFTGFLTHYILELINNSRNNTLK